MQRFDIITICTKNYRKALNFCLPSWLQFPSVRRVYVHTDFDFKWDDKRVVVRKCIDNTEDWLKVVGMKPLLLLRHMNTKVLDAGGNLAFIDIDCYMVRDVSEVFNGAFDLAVTRFTENGVDSSSGVLFFRASKRIQGFMKDWANHQEAFKGQGLGLKPYKSSYSQMALTYVLKRNKYRCNILPIEEKVYNNNRADHERWRGILMPNKEKVKMLHFKGQRWDNVERITSIFENKKREEAAK